MIYLTVPELLLMAGRATGGEVTVRDEGLLASVAVRPQASALGRDAYRSLEEKAAALLHSLAHNHALVDGNTRLAWAAVIAFLGVNGGRLTKSNDEAYDLVVAVAAGELDEVSAIADRLRRGSEAR